MGDVKQRGSVTALAVLAAATQDASGLGAPALPSYGGLILRNPTGAGIASIALMGNYSYFGVSEAQLALGAGWAAVCHSSITA